MEVNIAEGHPGTPTKNLSVVLGILNENNSLKVFRAYPGKFAPGFPGDHQSVAERTYNAEYWAGHAFIR
jgi:hypothetical protein